jgi:hypothetical protein
MSYEAKHCTKLELALRMIQNAVKSGIVPGYVPFDSWYSWPAFINGIRSIHHLIHVVCRLKNNNVSYEYKGKSYRLSELYQFVQGKFKKDAKTGLTLARVRVKMPGSEDDGIILFSKGYKEPETEQTQSRKKDKQKKMGCLSQHVYKPALIHHYRNLC